MMGLARMKITAVALFAFAACCIAGDAPPKPMERLELTSTIPVLNVAGSRSMLVSASLVRDRETGREWLIVSGAANAHVHVTEIQK